MERIADRKKSEIRNTKFTRLRRARIQMTEIRNTKYERRATSHKRRLGMTLTETTIVVGVMALLTALSIPAVRTFFSSMATAGNTRSLISAALSSARAIAAKEQRYAGIRFQKAGDPNNVLNAPQYIIFIIYEEPKNMGNLTVGFRAVEGIQPIKLSDDVGVIDTALIGVVNAPNGLVDATAFSIVFSPSGKLVIHNVQARNRDGKTDNSSKDDIFNTKPNVNAGIGMFYQDDYPGLGKEQSRNSFVIYETDKFKQAYSKGQAQAYLQSLIPKEEIYINPYTGTIVNNQ